MMASRLDRREFIRASAALTLTAASAGRVLGANERIGVAFLGAGGRCQAHIKILNQLHREQAGVEAVAVCDVWDGNDKVKRGLYYSAEKCGLKPADQAHVTKDYRRVLDLKEVDVVCIASPDHWHAKMVLDAARAGKGIFCEKPMTKTIEEAQAIVETVRRENRVMTVGVQSMADPRWRLANELIRAGKIGHVAQAQTSYYRNSKVGQWRYYRLTADMTPRTIDWDMFVGHRFEALPGKPLAESMPFDRALYGQWRCYWPFGSGVFTDLFVHQTTHMVAAMGVHYPARVVGAGGLYLEHDGRDVPDVATVVADYDEGCQLIVTATMLNRYPIEEVIRGHTGTIKFMKDGFAVIPDVPGGGAGAPARLEEAIAGEYKDCHSPKNGDEETKALWLDFLKCYRTGNRETVSTPELGAAAFTTVALGVKSYREGRALYWDKETRAPREADTTWAAKWERQSHQGAKPNQILGWQGRNDGSLLEPPAYQSLAGPWVDGKDPAGRAGVGG
jgi:predicted dehydrogenase